MKIESRTGKSTRSDKEIYDFITDFNNFKELLPSGRVTGWEANKESCSFHVDPIGRTGLEIVEKDSHSLVKISSIPEFSSYNFTIWIQLKRMAADDTRIRITIEPKVNMVLLPMIKGPLKQFVNSLMDKIETFDFK